MIQIGQTKDNLRAKWLVILFAHTGVLHAAGMPGGYMPHCLTDRAKVVTECTGDLPSTDISAANSPTQWMSICPALIWAHPVAYEHRA
jgi:hypothetical protein